MNARRAVDGGVTFASSASASRVEAEIPTLEAVSVASDRDAAPRQQLVPVYDPVAQLASASSFDLVPTVFWRDDSSAYIGLGCAGSVETSGPSRFADADARFAEIYRERPELRDHRWFGGFAFEDRVEGGAFEAFGALRFVLPKVVWSLDEGATQARLHAPPTTGDQEWARALSWARSRPSPVAAIDPEAEVDVGDREKWNDAVARVQGAFRDGTARKIVLSRDIHVRRRSAIDPASVLQRLPARSPSEAAFLFRAGADTFVGLSPERLVEVVGPRVRTEAVAGSSGAEDPEGRALLESQKDHEEHVHVVEHLVSRLSPYVERVEASTTPELRRLGHLAHLLTPVEGVRRGRASVLEVASALHPTPAVGGVPVQVACDALSAAEGRPRGWYAGAVGWVEPDRHGSGSGDLRVALRSALISGSAARLFVGAGVVPASTADGEWDETALKSVRLISALGGG